MIVYHGTIMEIQKPDINHSKAHLDFGIGFYTTTFKEIRYFKRNDQIAFLTQEIIDRIIVFRESYEVKS